MVGYPIQEGILYQFVVIAEQLQEPKWSYSSLDTDFSTLRDTYLTLSYCTLKTEITIYPLAPTKEFLHLQFLENTASWGGGWSSTDGLIRNNSAIERYPATH